MSQHDQQTGAGSITGLAIRTTISAGALTMNHNEAPAALPLRTGIAAGALTMNHNEARRPARG